MKLKDIQKIILLFSIVVTASCAHHQLQNKKGAITSKIATDAIDVHLIESYPAETNLDNKDILDAHDAWIQLIDTAQTKIDWSMFYAISHSPSYLEQVIQKLFQAADRGITIRILADSKFQKTYPQLLETFANYKNFSVAIYDVQSIMGGVLHAKYILVDNDYTFIGSQNFDWRSLEHIHELGLLIKNRTVHNNFQTVFDYDWNLATQQPLSNQILIIPTIQDTYNNQRISISTCASPQKHIPAGILFEEDQILKLINSSQKSLKIELLSYKETTRDNRPYKTLTQALKQAAQRGVTVDILVSDWSTRSSSIKDLQKLETYPGITIKLVSIPLHSSGFIPFARTIHAKYMIVDKQKFWLSTSNWGWDYFYQSRNIAVVVENLHLTNQLEKVFKKIWNSNYAKQVDPRGTYTAPQVTE